MNDSAAGGHDKLMYVSQQLDTMARNDELFDIHCPYCGGMTSPGKIFCCITIERACVALLDARDKMAYSLELNRQN
jgi:hypothetical protein